MQTVQINMSSYLVWNIIPDIVSNNILSFEETFKAFIMCPADDFVFHAGNISPEIFGLQAPSSSSYGFSYGVGPNQVIELID